MRTLSACATPPTISIIIPVHRGGKAFFRCLASVAAATPPPDEFVVVLDGADDLARQQAESFGAHITKTPSHSGPAAARNLGALATGSEVLFFVDADVLIPPDAVGQVAAAFHSEPDLTAVFGSYDDEPGAPNFLSQYKNLLHHYVHQTACQEASTFWAGCGAVRRDAFLALGGFDPRYRQPAIEDIELGYRLRQAGQRIRLLKTLQVRHLKRWTLRSLLHSDFFGRALPWSELILRSGGFINDLNVTVSSRLSVACACGLLVALLGAWRWPALWWAAGACAALLLALNVSLYRFFWRKRGWLFALGTIPWHWLYFLYSGLAFAVALARHLCAQGPGG